MTVTETITLIVCLGMEEEEADSQTMGADLQGPMCEPQPAEFQIMGEVSQLKAHIELNRTVRGEVKARLEVQ